ncbi:putative NTP pyrophosphohydrolase [Terriglobus roseus DSM 18391]|uniref:Putative NTP pyrophosphohydrolase n=1 Tax=Terriglobus roseus (strain DSM 18391 / NRRL B-41598 / KBS 63) TaxID=926566 RepID=I3ZJ70_TERRK|nr:NUDIX domain-containing protein [Terriglobus roseus]AFL89288.1 putative NTP pyrophosphohydrolase [Terriglobus roseus DSM 18391]
MSRTTSAGLLMFRHRNGELEVFLVHPGGPYWEHKDRGAWTVPKGQVEDGEGLLTAAQREFQEETRFLAAPRFLSLRSVRQKSGKTTFVWAFEGDCDPADLVSNTCSIVWPPRSGQEITIPEVDRGGWFSLADARPLIREEQRVLLQRLSGALRANESTISAL